MLSFSIEAILAPKGSQVSSPDVDDSIKTRKRKHSVDSDNCSSPALSSASEPG